VPSFVPPAPIDLKRTLAAIGVRDWKDGAAWWTVTTSAGTATVALASDNGVVEATGWGTGAQEALERVPRLLGFDDDPENFEAGELRDLHLRSPGLRLGSTGAVFDVLARGILAQVVTSAEAKSSHRNLVRVFGTPAPGPRDDLLVPPSPGAIAALQYEDLHPLGIERKRAETLLESARRAKRLDEIMDMDRDDAYRRLNAVRGIGPWTAAIVMGEAWGDRDAVLVGDYNLPSAVTWAFRGQRKGTDEEMLELLEPFRPNRRRALLLIKQSGVKPPRRGPKTPVRRHL
jgi:3-methyladenine DNA glycosylase/8-oxoguanine DNA glycosylase